MAAVKIYGTESNDLLGSAEISYAMKSKIAARLLLISERTATKLTVANGQKTTGREALMDVQIILGESVASPNFLIVDLSSVDVLIGYPTTEELQACLDLGH